MGVCINYGTLNLKRCCRSIANCHAGSRFRGWLDVGEGSLGESIYYVETFGGGGGYRAKFYAILHGGGAKGGA